MPLPKYFVALLLASALAASPAAAAEPLDATAGGGAVSLFDGESFDGWFFAPHKDPRAIAAMAPAERAAFLAEHAADGRAHWRVEDGEAGPEIVNDGEGPFLWTARDYADFELSLDWKITSAADSGVYIRGCPQVQIWDPDNPQNAKHDASAGSGGLWNNPRTGPNSRGQAPSERADRTPGEWNTFVIRVVGSSVTVHLNGTRIVNEATLENYWDRSLPLFPAGPIILQTHGGETRWRNLSVREIPRAMPESGFLLPDGSPAGEGWESATGTVATVGADAHAAFGPLDEDQTASVTLGTRVGTPGPAVKLTWAADGTATVSNPLAKVAALAPAEGGDAGESSPLPGVLFDGVAAAAAFDPAVKNRVYVRTVMGSVTCYLNGVPVFTAVDAPAPRDTAVPFAVAGPGASVTHVRNSDPRTDGGSDETGFVSVPLEEDLAGWEGDRNGYEAADGVLTCRGGNLYLAEELSDFTARFEFRLPPGGNNGVGLRFEKGQNAAYSGMESQLLDNAADVYKTIQPWQAHGSIYGVAPALRGYLKPVGHWNREEITVAGDRVRVVLNGKTIVDVNVREAAADGTVDGKNHPGLLRASGAFGFLGHGAPVAWRNLRLRVADDAE